MGIVTFLMSPLGKIVGWIAGVLGIIMVLSVVYLAWKAEIKHEALLEYNRKQLEEVAKEKDKIIEQMKALEAAQQAIEQANSDLNKKVDDQTGNIQTWLGESLDGKALDPIFNQMLNKLNGKE